MSRRRWWQAVALIAIAGVVLMGAFIVCTVLGERRAAVVPADWSGFDVLAQATPAPPPPSYPGGTISRAEHLQWVRWGEAWFRQETFGNERFWTDVVGLLSGTVQVPDGQGGYRDEPFVRFLLEAVDQLDGTPGNLFTGNGGPEGQGYTSDLVLTFPPGTLLDRSLPVPEKLHTGLDVEAGSPWPLGMIAIPAGPDESHLPYLIDPSRYADGPNGIGPVPPGVKYRVGLTCALCHFSLDVDWDGRADLRSTRPDRPTAGSPYLPRHTWALGNQDLALGWLGAFAANSVAGFAGVGPVNHPKIRPLDRLTGKDGREFGRWLKATVALHPDRAELEVDRGALLTPRGFADDTPDGLHNPLQFPVLFTYRNWPYNYDGVMLNATDRNNNVWTNGLDPSQLVSLCKDRGGRAAALLITQEPGLYSGLSAREYATILVTSAPLVKFDPTQKGTLINNMLGVSDGMPGLLRPDAMWVLRGIPLTVPKEILEHADNLDFERIRQPADLGGDAANRGAMVGLLGTRVATPPEIRKAFGLEDVERSYGLPAAEFLTEAVSLMLDWAEPPPNHSRLLEKGRSQGLVERGYQVFRQAGCASCHAGPFFTNNTIVPLEEIRTNDARARATGPLRAFLAPEYDLKTGRALPRGFCDLCGRVFGNRAPGYKVVTLRYLWGSAPYLHDGGVAVALLPGTAPAGDDLQDLLRRPSRDKVYGMAQILQWREAAPAGAFRPDAALSLQALFLKEERAKVISANRKSAYRVPGEDRWVSMAALNIEGVGHEYWVDDVLGGDRITALVAFLLGLDSPPRP